MAKKTLEEKIKLVCWWALGLTILYFLIGAWLISDGSKFDPTKTYDLETYPIYENIYIITNVARKMTIPIIILLFSSVYCNDFSP